MKTLLSLTLLFTLFMFTSCGSSVESEQNTWERNQKTVEEYAAAYPFYKESIHAQFKKAEIAMAAAKEIKDEEKKIEAMTKANNLALDGAVENIINLEKSIENVEKEIKKIKDDFTAEEFSTKTNFLLEEANTETNKAAISLQDTHLSTEIAIRTLETWVEKLNEIEKSLSNHYREIDSKRKKTEKVAGGRNDSINAAKTEALPVNCKKCGGKVMAEEVKCANCGAPVK